MNPETKYGGTVAFDNAIAELQAGLGHECRVEADAGNLAAKDVIRTYKMVYDCYEHAAEIVFLRAFEAWKTRSDAEGRGEMIRRGVAPFLECSTAGDRRLSAFVAGMQFSKCCKAFTTGSFEEIRFCDKCGKPCEYAWKSIEETYQGAKILENGRTGLSWREAKGRKAVNAAECAELYSRLWDRYIAEHPELLAWIRKWPGLSDKYGQPGRCCQAVELWRIRNASDKLLSDAKRQ
jgi:hypothetical protein